MIVLQDVQKSGGFGHRISPYSLEHVSLELPAVGRVAILGRETSNMTMFLHLVAGSQIPDQGRVRSGGARCSPIMNLSGVAGAALSPKLGVLANIKYFAGVRGADYLQLLATVALTCDIGQKLDKHVITLDPPTRRALEVSLVGALPYDYYLVDKFQTLEPAVRWQLMAAVQARRAALVFATTDPNTAVRFGELGILCLGGRLRVFRDVRATAEAYLRANVHVGKENRGASSQ